MDNYEPTTLFDISPNSKPPCEIDNCGKPSLYRAMCKTHYARWKRHKDPRLLKKKQSLVRTRAKDGLKFCDDCKVTKVVTEFYRHACRSDGLADYCIKCTKVRTAAATPTKTEKQYLHIKPEDAMYLAGFIDGEGSILIYERRNYQSEGSNRAYTMPFNMRLTISNTHEGIIRWVRSICGGIVTAQKTRRTGSANSWKWTTSARIALNVLKAIYPHLKIKKEEARLAIEFQERVMAMRFTHAPHSGKRGQMPLPPEEVAIRADYVKRITDAKYSYKQYDALQALPRAALPEGPRASGCAGTGR